MGVGVELNGFCRGPSLAPPSGTGVLEIRSVRGRAVAWIGPSDTARCIVDAQEKPVSIISPPPAMFSVPEGPRGQIPFDEKFT